MEIIHEQREAKMDLYFSLNAYWVFFIKHNVCVCVCVCVCVWMMQINNFLNNNQNGNYKNTWKKSLVYLYI